MSQAGREYTKTGGAKGKIASDVAIKVIDKSKVEDMADITREIEIMGMVEHPNVMQLLDYHTKGCSLMLVLPYVPHSLADLLGRLDAPMLEVHAHLIPQVLFVSRSKILQLQNTTPPTTVLNGEATRRQPCQRKACKYSITLAEFGARAPRICSNWRRE